MVRLFLFYSFLCFVFVISLCFSSSFEHHICSPNEAKALLKFKQSFIISNYSQRWIDFPRTESWNESRDCCTWDGVTCDMLTGHVIGLDLSCSRLNGTIHPNSSLFQLHHLQTLNLAYNHFNHSSIPHNIGRLTNLRHLNLSDAYFGGKIPAEISYLSNLVSLDLSSYYHSYGLQLDQRTFERMLHNFTNLEVLSLSHVNISSPIPLNISSSSLRYVDLEYTNLQGILAERFFLLPDLESLKLGGNDLLKGVLPKLHPSNTLLELDISYTGISDELSDYIGTFGSLNFLGLYGCQLFGSIPDSLGNLTEIRELYLGGNRFTGHIPDSIGNLTQIRELDLGRNCFTGHIPDSIGNLTQIRELYLGGNCFTGHIPDSIGNLTEIRELDLGGNCFTGHIPSSILSLTHLETLDLRNNSLSVPLTNNASMLQKLTKLDLSYNSLNGTIPSWVFSLPLLNELPLDHNRFSGLPNELKTNPALEYLYLSHNQLSGSFLQSLTNLTNLSFLDISSNKITDDVGRINITFPRLEYLLSSSCNLKDFPHFLRNIKTLECLDISNNKIRGQIPNWFSSMKWNNLLYLNLSHNSLTGNLPQFHHYNLKYLDLKFNSLQGPLPSSICNMSGLSLLDLSHNYFSDSVPHCLGSIWLSVLDLRRNNFTGNLPPLCAGSTSLSTIVLNGNQFEGTLPMSLLNCHDLEVLDVGNNAINDTFPAWLGTFRELQVLIFKSNKFHGPIATTMKKFYFPRLRIFDLSCNEFSHSLPARLFENFSAMTKLERLTQYMEQFDGISTYEDSVRLVIKGNDIELEKISTIMTVIDLSSNHFEGAIPKTLMDLGSLWLLNLSRNNLSGDIPMELGQLNKLEALDLSWNRLTGKIPQELTRLTFLEKLNLSQNLLVGPIPHGPQFNTFENDSYGGNLDLCGTPLSKQCETSNPSHVPQPLEAEEEEDESLFFSGFTWESVVIGYSFGLVVGTVMWSLMFKYRKPKCLVEFFEGIIPQERRRTKKSRPRRRT